MNGLRLLARDMIWLKSVHDEIRITYLRNWNARGGARFASPRTREQIPHHGATVTRRDRHTRSANENAQTTTGSFEFFATINS